MKWCGKVFMHAGIIMQVVEYRNQVTNVLIIFKFQNPRSDELIFVAAECH